MSKLTLSVLSATKVKRKAAAYPYSGNWHLKRWQSFFCMCCFLPIYLSCRLRSNDNLSHHYFAIFSTFGHLGHFDFYFSDSAQGLHSLTGVGVKKCPPLPSKTTPTPFADLLMHQFGTLRENPKVSGNNFLELTRVPLGGANIAHPCRIFLIAQKRRQLSTWNFLYLLQHQFDIGYQNFRKICRFFFEKMAFLWRHVSPLRVKKQQMFEGCQNV